MLSPQQMATDQSVAFLSSRKSWTYSQAFLHDMRRGISTYLEENGLDRAYTARKLNHKDTSVTGIYARLEHRHHLECVMSRWSEVLSGTSGLDAENVLLFAS